jgi:hypothetical protein
VGLFPAKEVSGVGQWMSDSSRERLIVNPDSGIRREPLAFEKTDLSSLEWRPNADGISSFIAPPSHPVMNHGDWPRVVTFVPLGPDRALRYLAGGCNWAPNARFEYFHRVITSF